MIKTLILIPTREEYQLFISSLPKGSLASMALGKIKGYIMQNNDCFIACGGKGRLQFGITAQHILDSKKEIETLICAGSAGALDENLRIGDIIIAEKTVLFDQKGIFQRKLPVFNASKEFLNTFRKNADEMNKSRVFTGIIASGDEDIIDRKRASEISAATNAAVTAWEGAGGAAAARFHRKSFVEIRCVSDICSHHNFENYTENLGRVMQRLADFLIFEDNIKKHFSN